MLFADEVSVLPGVGDRDRMPTRLAAESDAEGRERGHGARGRRGGFGAGGGRILQKSGSFVAVLGGKHRGLSGKSKKGARTSVDFWN